MTSAALFIFTRDPSSCAIFCHVADRPIRELRVFLNSQASLRPQARASGGGHTRHETLLVTVPQIVLPGCITSVNELQESVPRDSMWAAIEGQSFSAKILTGD